MDNLFFIAVLAALPLAGAAAPESVPVEQGLAYLGIALGTALATWAKTTGRIPFLRGAARPVEEADCRKRTGEIQRQLIGLKDGVIDQETKRRIIEMHAAGKRMGSQIDILVDEQKNLGQRVSKIEGRLDV